MTEKVKKEIVLRDSKTPFYKNKKLVFVLKLSLPYADEMDSGFGKNFLSFYTAIEDAYKKSAEVYVSENDFSLPASLSVACEIQKSSDAYVKIKRTSNYRCGKDKRCRKCVDLFFSDSGLLAEEKEKKAKKKTRP